MRRISEEGILCPWDSQQYKVRQGASTGALGGAFK